MDPQTPPNTPSRSAERASIGPWALAAAGVALAGIGLAIAADFAAVIRIQLNTVEVAHYTGMDRSSVALIVLGLLALVLLLGAIRGARPAMAALALVGIGILLVAVLVDVPHLHDTGVWPKNDVYEDAQATPGMGFYMETAAGILLLLGGVLMLVLALRPAEPAPSERRAARRGERRTDPEPPAAGGVTRPTAELEGPRVAAEPVPDETAPPPPPSFEIPELPAELPEEPSRAARFSEPQSTEKRRSGGLVGRFGMRKR